MAQVASALASDWSGSKCRDKEEPTTQQIHTQAANRLMDMCRMGFGADPSDPLELPGYKVCFDNGDCASGECQFLRHPYGKEDEPYDTSNGGWCPDAGLPECFNMGDCASGKACLIDTHCASGTCTKDSSFIGSCA